MMSVMVKIAKEIDESHDILLARAGWSRRQRGACLGDGVAFQEKAGYLVMSLFVQGGAEDNVERVLAMEWPSRRRLVTW